MSDRLRAEVIGPDTAMSDGEAGPYPFDLFERRCLAQGDSWFSIGALPPMLTSRIVDELRLQRSTVIVNCAYPGAVLRRMVDSTRSPQFRRLLAGKLAMRWNAILFSGGGNDLIEALGSAPDAQPHQRLLRTPAERGPDPLPADCISEPGWLSFAAHVQTVFGELLDLRDSGINRSTPLVLHNYARVMPRPSAAAPGFGPWLWPAMQTYAVPSALLLALSDELMDRLQCLLDEVVAARWQQDPDCGVYLADSMASGVDLADAGSTGASGDWINEIHLTRAGYRKCAQAWQAVLDPLLA